MKTYLIKIRVAPKTPEGVSYIRGFEEFELETNNRLDCFKLAIQSVKQNHDNPQGVYISITPVKGDK